MLVLTGASLFQCALLGVLANSTGVLLTQIRMELELSMTEISAYYTIKSVVGALGGAFFAALFFKSDKKRYLLFNIFTLVASYLLLLVGAGNWLWYVAAALSGRVVLHGHDYGAPCAGEVVPGKYRICHRIRHGLFRRRRRGVQSGGLAAH